VENSDFVFFLKKGTLFSAAPDENRPSTHLEVLPLQKWAGNRAEKRFAWLPTRAGQPFTSHSFIVNSPLERTPTLLFPWEITGLSELRRD
jgi:hypothetical protein